jgi:hypothetical protein
VRSLLEGENLLALEDGTSLIRSCLDANGDLAEQPKDEDERTEPDVLRETFRPIDPEEALDMADVFECCNHVFRDA